jgi:hypothetical protein
MHITFTYHYNIPPNGMPKNYLDEMKNYPKNDLKSNMKNMFSFGNLSCDWMFLQKHIETIKMQYM